MKTLRALNNEVYLQYLKTKNPVSIDCRINNIHIIQDQPASNAGWSHIYLENGENIMIKWQASNANIFIDKVSEPILNFLYESLLKYEENQDLVEDYYYVNIKNNPVDSDTLVYILNQYSLEMNYKNHEKLVRRIYPDCDEEEVRYFME